MFKHTKSAAEPQLNCIDPFCDIVSDHEMHPQVITLDVVAVPDLDVASTRAIEPSAVVRAEVTTAMDAIVASEAARWRSRERKARVRVARRHASERAHSELANRANNLCHQLDDAHANTALLERQLAEAREWTRELERITVRAQREAEQALAKVVRLHG
jgi:flagellar biosynthesis GTPase FlhF